MNELKVGQAFEIIKQAMVDDEPEKQGSYAHSWHCNLAMMYYDAYLATIPEKSQSKYHAIAHKVGNDAASRFVKLCFGVQTQT